MKLIDLILTFISNLFARVFAWRYDRYKDVDHVTTKRRELVETIEAGGKVLEIGAGTGSSLKHGIYEAPAGRFSKLILSEPDTGMRERLESKLNECRSRVASEHVAVMDVALPDLPFDTAEFDAVVMYFVASHISDRKSAAEEIARVLKPGGKLLFMDHGAHDHDHSHTHSHQHVHVHEHKRPKPWFWEMIRFMATGPKDKIQLDGVLKELRAESLLQEEFQTRVEVDGFFKEITYGVFSRRV